MLRVLAASLFAASAAVTQPGRTERQPTATISVSPAPPPSPALSISFRTPYADRTGGNAAVEYMKALAVVRRFDPSEYEKVAEPDSQEFDAAAAATFLQANLDPAWDMIVAASRCEQCDWQTPFREGSIGVLLPELGSLRTLARLIALRSSVQIARRDFTGAVESIRVGMELARHAAAGPTLIQVLVGQAIGSLMLERVSSLSSAPGAPNLYWALTELERPFISIAPAMQNERSMLELTFPELKRMTAEVPSPQAAKAIVAAHEARRDAFYADFGVARPDPSAIAIATASIAAGQYPAARKAMLDEGVAPEKVDALPVAYVALRFNVLEYRRRRDELHKWFLVPYSQAAQSIEAAQASFQESIDKTLGRPFTDLMSGADTNFALNQATLDRRIAAMRIVEAIRLHAAANRGLLPTSLDALSAVPIPRDPVTDLPFSYVAEPAGTAIVAAPTLPARTDPPPRNTKPIQPLVYRVGIRQ